MPRSKLKSSSLTEESLVTIKTVAEAADCAVSTVSRALRDDPAISEQAKKRVREAARRLNYQPLRKRRSLPRPSEETTSSETREYLLLSLGLDRSLTALPAIAETINGLEDALSSFELRMQVTHIPDVQRTPPQLGDLDSIDGVFLIGPMQGRMLADSDSPLLARLQKLRTVWLLGRPEGCRGDSVGANDWKVGMLAARHLAERGHRHVAYFSPKPDHSLMMNREGGFLAEATRQGMKVDRFTSPPTEGWNLPLKPPLDADEVTHLVQKFLRQKKRPTAIFTGSDAVAAVLYAELGRRGIQVGEEVSIISGNNDRALIAGLHPQLTTIDIQAREIGRVAVHQMETRIRAGKTLPEMELFIDPQLVVRESVRDFSSLKQGTTRRER
ncbi:Ribose operon repressor [Planctomycetales bacterium 10988]|nr:Ribose operon repressor [Planctomycetales bacterium 10988]